MEYVVYRRFKAEGIDGAFNLRYGTTVTERDGFLFAADGRKICAATSENGWEHFRPNTPEGAYRQKMLDGLYRFYGKHEGASDFDPEKWAGAENLYWKNLLRTMNTQELEGFYKKRLGELPKMEGYPPARTSVYLHNACRHSGGTRDNKRLPRSRRTASRTSRK